jgi:hypothetical protein
VLSSALVKHLQDQGLAVAYYFFCFNDPARENCITAVRSLALQILTQTNEVPDQVMKLYEADVENHILALRDLQTAILVLQAFLKLPSRIHIIIDGLDECREGPIMQNSLFRLMSTTTYGIVKWFFTSRNEKDIRTMAHQLRAAEIEPSPAVVISDIKTYLESWKTKAGLRPCCIESWAVASDGNFLWMKLTLEILAGMDLTCEEEIEEELEKFPTGLAGCYLRSLERLSQRSKQQQELARRIFTTLVVAEQPLHLSELSNYLGIRVGAQDYSVKRVPRLSLIEDLCSHLVVFDRIAKGNEKDPLLRLAHKSVQDFFNLDPDSLDRPIADGLRQYFVNQEAANLEMGKHCLTYLSYGRYQQPLDNLELLGEDDHAFLKYAATFWFQHLSCTSDCHELFSSVEEFIQSPAFWTCLRVQCKVAPHLLTRLVDVGDGLFRLGAKKLNDSEGLNEQAINFAFALPDWLDQCTPSGPVIIQEYLRFIKDWHSVFIMYPQALNQCIRDLSGSTYPCRNPSQSKGIRVLRIEPPNAQRKPSNILLQTFEVNGNALRGMVIEQEEGSKHYLSIRKVCIDNNFVERPKILQENIHEQTVEKALGLCKLHVFAEDGCGNISIWSLDVGDLKMSMDSSLQASTFKPPEDVNGFTPSSMKSTTEQWSIVPRPSGDHNSNAFGFHCFKAATRKNDEDDSGYGTLDSQSDSEEDLDDEQADEHSIQTHHCLVLASHGCSPLWFPWLSNTRELQVISAAHPTKPIVIWTHAAHEFRVANLQMGQIKAGVLPEPVGIRLRSASAIRKGRPTRKFRSCTILIFDKLEMHFSRDGKIVYYLVCFFTDETVGSTCSVSVSSFYFPENINELGEDLLRTDLNQHITYRVPQSVNELSPNFSLTHWTPEYLYIALPDLSSRPKIVRLGLELAVEPDSAAPQFQTLQVPLYFPASTYYRNPQIFIQRSTDPCEKGSSSGSPSEQLILALAPESQSNANGPTVTSTSSPIFVIWSISRTNSWRDWFTEVDECSVELEENQRTYERLRGNFVDSEQRFKIPIRSGLDWTKKAFLSCA